MQANSIIVMYHERGDYVTLAGIKKFINGNETKLDSVELESRLGAMVETRKYSYKTHADASEVKARIKQVAARHRDDYLAREAPPPSDLDKAVTTYGLEASATLVEGVLAVATQIVIAKQLDSKDKYEIAKLILMAEGLNNA